MQLPLGRTTAFVPVVVVAPYSCLRQLLDATALHPVWAVTGFARIHSDRAAVSRVLQHGAPIQ